MRSCRPSGEYGGDVRHCRRRVFIGKTSRSAAVLSASQSPASGINGHRNGDRQLDPIDVAAGLRPVVEFLLELERTVTDGVQDGRDHLQMRSRILQLP